MKTKKAIFAIVVVVLGTILTSCYWKNWDTIHGVTPGGGGGSSSSTTCTVPSDSILYSGVMIYRPDTSIGTGTRMSYSIDIAPIVAAKCGTSTACHAAGTAGALGNTDLSFYGGHHSGLDQVCSGGDTTNAIVWNYIRGTGGVNQMPLAGNTQLTTCEINKLRNWINQGAQNN